MKVANIIFLHAYVIFINEVYSFDLNSRPKGLKIDRLTGRCRKYPKAPMTLENVQLRYSNTDFIINMKLVMKESFSDKLTLKIKIKRCSSKEALDTCESIPDLTLSDLCNYVNAENQPWTRIVQLIQPTLSCPFQKGVYSAQNASVDVNTLRLLPVDNFYIKAEVSLIDNARESSKSVIFCTEADFQIVYLKT